MSTREAFRVKPHAGNPHMRFDEGEGALATSRSRSLRYRTKTLAVCTVVAKRTAFAVTAISAVLTPLALSAGTVTDWKGGTGGSEEAPLEIYDGNNWSSGELPSSA